MSAVLIDGSGLIYRAYYGFPPLTKTDGAHVGAVYGFCYMLMSIFEKHSFSHYAVMFDKGRKTFRSELYPEYKGNRAKTPDDLLSQFPLIREACVSLGVIALDHSDFEADDLIASYAKFFHGYKKKVKIISSDKDLLQLIDGDDITVYDPLKNKRVAVEETVEKFGIYPSQVIDFLALVGDSSDNIPGVDGVGVKTAAKLLQEFESIDGIYENINHLSDRIRNNFFRQKEQVKLAKILITLRTDISIPFTLDHFANNGINYSTFGEFCQRYEFHSLFNKVKKYL